MINVRKIAVVLTTRGNYAKMRSVLSFISNDRRLELQLVVGKNLKTSRYGNYVKEIIKDGFQIRAIVDYLVDEDSLKSMTHSAGTLTSKLSIIFEMFDNSDNHFEIVGSYRREKEDSGDIDIIITNSKNDKSIFNELLDYLKQEK